MIAEVLAAAGLDCRTAPALAGVSGQAGRDGVHTEAMGYLLAELQSVATGHAGGDMVSRPGGRQLPGRARQIAELGA